MYAAIDEIAASVPIDGLISGQRPWSKAEVARIIAAFENAVRHSASPGAGAVPSRVLALVDSLNAAYEVEIRQLNGAPHGALEGAPLRGAYLEIVGNNSTPRAVPTSNGLGWISAETNPFIDPNWGRPIADGGTVSLETLHEIGIGGKLAFGAQPRVSWLQRSAGGGSQEADFQRLYARAVVANVGLEAGMDEVLWGQAGDRGMLLSANPRPLHAVTLSNDTTITLPWLLRFAGRIRLALMYAQLGNAQYFPGSQLVNYKVSFTPTPRLELGAGMMDEMGGGGSPRCSFACRVKDLFPYIMWIHPASDPLATNKVAVGELRYRIPEAAGLTLTYEGDMDDFDLRRIRSTLWDNTAHVVGARFDRLTPDGRLALDLQVEHTPLTLYEHTQFRSGLTYRDAIVGDPLGVHGTGAHATITWRRSLLSDVALAAAFESRDASTYAVHMTNANGSGWTFVQLTDPPKEQRVRLGASLDRKLFGEGLGYSAMLGVERVLNYDYVAGSARTNGIAEVTVRRYF